MLRDILYESGERILGMYHRNLLFNFDFGMRHSIGFLLMLFTANVLLVAIYLLVSTFVNQEESLWQMASFSAVLIVVASFRTKKMQK